MKKILVFCALLAVTLAAPTEDAQAKIISYENNNDGSGNYDFSFETSNGIQRRESGKLLNAGQPNVYIQVKGIFSYTDTNGEIIVVEYTADQNGYHVMMPQAFIEAEVSPNVVASLLG